MDQIENEFQAKSLARGATFLFHPEDAIKVIERCRVLNKKILGIDSFEITDTETKQLDILDCSIDESNQAKREQRLDV